MTAVYTCKLAQVLVRLASYTVAFRKMCNCPYLALQLLLHFLHEPSKTFSLTCIAQHQRCYGPHIFFQDFIDITHKLSPRCACGSTNNEIHSKNCHLGGYNKFRHDTFWNFINKKASTAYKYTETDPKLRSIDEESLNPSSERIPEPRLHDKNSRAGTDEF